MDMDMANGNNGQITIVPRQWPYASPPIANYPPCAVAAVPARRCGLEQQCRLRRQYSSHSREYWGLSGDLYSQLEDPGDSTQSGVGPTRQRMASA